MTFLGPQVQNIWTWFQWIVNLDKFDTSELTISTHEDIFEGMLRGTLVLLHIQKFVPSANQMTMSRYHPCAFDSSHSYDTNCHIQQSWKLAVEKIAITIAKYINSVFWQFSDSVLCKSTGWVKWPSSAKSPCMQSWLLSARRCPPRLPGRQPPSLIHPLPHRYSNIIKDPFLSNCAPVHFFQTIKLATWCLTSLRILDSLFKKISRQETPNSVVGLKG